MDLHKLGIKFFMTDPNAVPAHDFIPVFQSWIQRKAVPDHLLIDVHNYSHIHNGPGILLVAHEGNFSIDGGEGRTGLLYVRKQPGGNPVKTALHACSLLENEPAFEGRLRFRKNELDIVANDRLQAPNDEKTFSQLQAPLAALLQQELKQSFTLKRISEDPKERLTIRATL